MKFSKIHHGLLGMYTKQSFVACIILVFSGQSPIAAPAIQFAATSSTAENPLAQPLPHMRPVHPARTNSPFKLDSMVGAPGLPLPLVIELPKDYEAQFSFAMIKGLPKNFKLSAGFQTNSSWLVLLNEVEGLVITPPEDFQGHVEFEIVLYKDKNSPAITQKAEIDIQMRYASQVQSADVQPLDAATAALPSPEAAPSLLRLEDETASAPTASAPMAIEYELMMRRASQALRNSDVSSARQFYERLARLGLAEAAFAMGQTYDPNFLDQLNVHGLKADLETARLWYEKASELGSDEAKKLLSTFSN